MSTYDDWKPATPPWYEDDDQGGDYEREPEPERPLFGCACEDPSSVDTVCAGCIEWLKEQGHAGQLRRGKVAAALYRRHSRRNRRAIRPMLVEEIPF